MDFVDEADALAAAGPGAEVFNSGDVTYALGPQLLVVLLEAGDRPGGSCVDTAQTITLSAPIPDAVEDSVRAQPRIPISAFVRLAGGCLSLGPVRVGSVGRQDMQVFIDTPLPDNVLDRVRPVGPAPDQPSLDWLDLLPADPLGALRRFVAGWYGEAPPARDVDEGLPPPLVAFHRLAGGRSTVYGESIRMYSQPFTSEGRLAIGQESDGVFSVVVDPGDDPTVYYDGLGDGLLAEREPLSGFLLLSSLARAAMEGDFGGMAIAGRDQVDRVVAPLRPVPMRPMRWPSDETRFHVGPGLVVEVGDDGDEWLDLYVGARHRALLRPVRGHGLDWEHFDG